MRCRSAGARGLAAMAAVVAAGIVLAGCHSSGPPHRDASGLPVDRPVARTDLSRLPQSRLYYPGSRLIVAVGSDQTPTRDGEEPNPAYDGAILTVAAAPTQLYQWYGRELAGEGFQPTVDYRPSTQVSGQAWQSHRRLEVQVGVVDPDRLRADQHISVPVPTGTIVYEMIVVGYAPGLPKAIGKE